MKAGPPCWDWPRPKTTPIWSATLQPPSDTCEEGRGSAKHVTLGQTRPSSEQKTQTYEDRGRVEHNPTMHSKSCPIQVASPSSLCCFCFSSGLVCDHSLTFLSFDLSRSLSLCFLDFFLRCWPRASCCSQSPCLGWRLLSLVWCSGHSEGLCVTGKPAGPPGEPLWSAVLLPIRWKSVFEW